RLPRIVRGRVGMNAETMTPGAVTAVVSDRLSGTIRVRPIPWDKRALDILLAGAGLVVSFPLWCLIAAAVKLADHGPVFYGQDRVGEGGRIFRALKFRAMVAGAAGAVGAIQAVHGDPRVTLVGRVLRATAMDELP